jgi:hypothetical protein
LLTGSEDSWIPRHWYERYAQTSNAELDNREQAMLGGKLMRGISETLRFLQGSRCVN